MGQPDDHDYEMLERALMDSRPVRLEFTAAISPEDRARNLMLISFWYRRMGGGAMVVDLAGSHGDTVRLVPRDDPKDNLVY